MRWLCLFIIVVLVCSCGPEAKFTGPSASRTSVVERRGPGDLVTTETLTVEAKGPDYAGEAAKDVATGAVEVQPETASVGKASLAGFEADDSLNPLYIAGGVVLVGGVVVGYFAGWGLGLVISAAGGALLVTARVLEVYPWVGLVAGALCLAAAVGVGYSLWRGSRARDVVRALAGEWDAMPNSDSQPEEANLVKRAGRKRHRVVAEIAKSKVEAGAV